MSGRYAPLPTDREARHEMDAAFDDSDDEGDDSESRPLNPAPTSPTSSPTHFSRPSATHVPGTYDFENVDYDYPPPGSPPGPSATALPNEYGNSNGLVPSFSVDTAAAPRPGWFNRTAAAVLPSHYVQRLGFGSTKVIGNNNDGVFANVTAKPTPPVRVQDGDSTYLVPEDTRAEPPPSYASAQADAVPQYWETTVHAPFAPGTAGEMIIDSLPSGSLFSFLWNMLISISFQFIGFILTFLFHSTHAARLGSRAGLGVTLIQYGFALRSRGESLEDEAANSWSGWNNNPRPTFPTAAEAAAYYNGSAEALASTGIITPEEANAAVADATYEWFSFFLMTIGWFILLTSVLGFWRVKRWERGVLASQRENPGAQIPPPSTGPFMTTFEQSWGLRNTSDLFRSGLGLRSRQDDHERMEAASADPAETEFMIPADADPERARQLQEAIRNERRLHAELRAAGLI
ncbi:hypothetical protein C8F04DRAFT_989994 [Mycena alexandri]|uniref:Metal homeostatis protein bsd2 n=1 Tax=Mycena alexandri TaxID=1745969 RepID=A0AAD6TFL5_9AGAR|nr:hypothetical protein C8F04DRAFT_989994 [Mycena alexandri]